MDNIATKTDHQRKIQPQDEEDDSWPRTGPTTTHSTRLGHSWTQSQSALLALGMSELCCNREMQTGSKEMLLWWTISLGKRMIYSGRNDNRHKEWWLSSQK